MPILMAQRSLLPGCACTSPAYFSIVQLPVPPGSLYMFISSVLQKQKSRRKHNGRDYRACGSEASDRRHSWVFFGERWGCERKSSGNKSKIGCMRA